MKPVLFAILALVVGGCASASGSGQPDADPNVPDADPNVPDADPAAPDANQTTCSTAPCDLIDQCGCTGGMPACDIDFTDLMGNACRPVTVPGDTNDTCTSVAQCAGGYVCVGGGTKSCKEYCDADLDCGTPRGKCVIQLTSGAPAVPIAGAIVCSSNCDPIASSNADCPTNWSCDLFTATFNTVEHDIVDCRLPGTSTQGQPCNQTTQLCGPGLSCYNNGTGTVCGEICRQPIVAGDCAAGTCGGFTPPFIIAGQEYGVCAP